MVRRIRTQQPVVEEPKVEEPKVGELYAGKKVVKRFSREGGQFIVLESGEEIKL